MTDYPIVQLGGDQTAWEHGYRMAGQLNLAFPGQDAEDLGHAAANNDTGPLVIGAVVQDIEMIEQGQNDGGEWTWRVEVDGEVWYAVGGCDYTGWDCQSHLEWSQVPNER